MSVNHPWLLRSNDRPFIGAHAISDDQQNSARLAAEAAFGPPVISQPMAAPPQVIVRRKRACDPHSEPATHVDVQVVEAEARAPRVFRLATHHDVSAETSSELSLPAPTTSTVAAPEPVRPVKFRRTRSQEKRPTVIRHVVVVQQGGLPQLVDAADASRASPACNTAAPSADVSSPPVPPQSTTSPAKVAASDVGLLDTVFADIRVLQDFQVEDDRYAREWLRLSKVADRIQADLDRLIAKQRARSKLPGI